MANGTMKSTEGYIYLSIRRLKVLSLILNLKESPRGVLCPAGPFSVGEARGGLGNKRQEQGIPRRASLNTSFFKFYE